MSTADSLVILPPKRRSNIPELVNTLAQTLRGQQAEKDEKARYAQSVEDDRAKVIASQFMKLRPEQQAQMYATLPPSVQKFIQDPNSVPAPQLSDLEYRQQEVAKERATKEQRILMGLPEDLGAGGRDASYNLVTKSNPTAQVSGANVGQYVYENKETLPGEMVSGQRIADKIDPTGQERIVHRDVTVPKTRAEIAETNAKTGKLGAETDSVREGITTSVETRTPGSQGNAAYAERVRAAAAAKADAKQTNPANKGETTGSMATQAREVIRRLISHPGRTGAVGVKDASSLFGALETPFDGTDEADFLEDLNRLKALVTLPNLEQLRGLGHMSDREFNTMQQAAAALGTGRKDESFLRELYRVDQIMTNVEKRAAAQSTGLANQGRFDAATESGIANVMRTQNMTREQAIAALRQRGAL